MPVAAGESRFIVVQEAREGWTVPPQTLHPHIEGAEGLRDQGNYRAELNGRPRCYQLMWVTVQAIVPRPDQIRAWLESRGWRELPVQTDRPSTGWRAPGGGVIHVPADTGAASTIAAVELIAAAAAMSLAELTRQMTLPAPP